MSSSAIATEPPDSASFPAVAAVSLAPFVLYCVAHLAVDLYSGSLGVLQPLLLAKFHLSLTQAGLLGGMLSLSSSVSQPLYGLLSDRYPSRLFTVLAPAVAGIFISGLGLASGFPMLLAMVFLGGAGMASFHPHAAANATSGIKHARGRAMAIFISSGTVGLALGPAVFSAICGRWGLTAGAFAALFGIFITALLFIFLKPTPASAGLVRARFEWAPLRAVARPLTILYLLVFLRSVVQIVFTQFLPLYLKTQRGFSLTGASYSLSLFLIAGALGGVAGGHLADRFGGKRVIVISMLGAAPLLALFLFTSGWLSTVALFICGLVLLFTVPVNVVMAQRLAPGQMGTVSALMMGFSWGMAGVIFIPLIGWIADHSSLQFAFTALVAFPLIGFVLALRLKIPATA